MRVPSIAFNFEAYHAERQRLIEERLSRYLGGDDPSSLWEAMRYSVLSAGKRIRATLCIAAAEAVALDNTSQELEFDSLSSIAIEQVLPCACAVEMIHAMSLIHDDLPCMDNDDFRRGKPSNHKVFGEAMALLAGDALLVYAFDALLGHSSPDIDPRRLGQVARELAVATGARGMVGGQVADMAVTGQAIPLQSGGASIAPSGLTATDRSSFQSANANVLSQIHARKTGALIRFSVWSGACLMGASDTCLSALSKFGDILGLSFQIADDLLDVTGDIKTIGKTPGKDSASGKLTWISVYGEQVARQKLADLEREGQELLKESELSEPGLRPLRALLSYAIHRSH